MAIESYLHFFYTHVYGTFSKIGVQAAVNEEEILYLRRARQIGQG
jgi:hypothetical protein